MRATQWTAPSPATAPAPAGDPYEHARAEREADALREARRHVSVTLYSTSWCPSCRAARSWFSASGIAFTDLDVENDSAARAAYHALNPRGSVPTVDIDGHVLVGFSSANYVSAIEQAVQRRASRF